MSDQIKEILETIKKEKVEFVDLRFTDTKGKEQHVSIPASAVDDDFFECGKMFDGSSIAGWKGINKSDMVLMPDPSTWKRDPFTKYETWMLRCDILEPDTMQGYDRDPRSIAKRAEAYLKSTGIADTVIFGPEPEFFLFDNVTFGNNMNGCFYQVDTYEGAWNSSKQYEEGNLGHRPFVKGGYFPVPPVDSDMDIRSEMCKTLEDFGLVVEAHHHEVATGGQNEIATRFNTLTKKADELQIYKYVTMNNALQPVPLQGRQEPVLRRRIRRPFTGSYLLHRRNHQAREVNQRLLQPDHQLLQAPGSGLRGSCHARVLRSKPLRLHQNSCGIQP